MDKTGTSVRNKPGSGSALLLATGLIFFAPTPVFAVPPLPEFPTQAIPPTESFQDWTVDCATGCEMRTQLRGNQPGAAEVLRLTLRHPAREVWDLTITTPLPLYLPDPLSLAPEEGEPVTLPWYTCGATGCEARLSLAPDLLRLLKKGRGLTVELSLVDRTRVRLPVSLIGFTAASRRLAVRSAP